MKWFAETTNYGEGTANGIYLLNDSKDKMFAFRSPVTNTIKVFNAPIRIDLRGRQFKVNPEQFPVEVTEEEPTDVPRGRVRMVQGSKGETYYVSEYAGVYTCTCSGFKFRGKCRHAVPA